MNETANNEGHGIGFGPGPSFGKAASYGRLMGYLELLEKLIVCHTDPNFFPNKKQAENVKETIRHTLSEITRYLNLED